MLGRIGSALALASVTTLMVVGCTPEEPVESTPPPPSEGTPSAELTAREVEVEAFALAQEFVALVDEGFATSALPIERLEQVATQTAIDKVQAELDQFEQLGWSIEGTSTVDSPTLNRWDEAEGSAQVLACLDTSGITTTLASGEPAPGTQSRQPRLFSFEYVGKELLVTDISVVPQSTRLPGCGS